jgi:phosphoribosyl 1,2-cyclic phosphate phosphodiesterase
MQVTFLGTGTSSGVPVLTCSCDVCTSADFRDNRLRVSVYIQVENLNLIIDTGPDFRQQAFRANIQDIDAVLYTHEHRDHTAGLDDIRPYNYMKGPKACHIYAQERVINQLKSEYYYAFGDNRYPGVPLLDAHVINTETVEIKGVQIQAIQIQHHKLDILGYRIGDFSYITDANHITDAEIEKLKGSKYLVLNALQYEPHISHFTVEEAIEVAQKIGAEKTFFTHIGHRIGLHTAVEASLPENIFLAYDGLKLTL